MIKSEELDTATGTTISMLMKFSVLGRKSTSRYIQLNVTVVLPASYAQIIFVPSSSSEILSLKKVIH
jgi:hypothetical protein